MTDIRKYISESLQEIVGGLEDFADSQENNGATPFAEINATYIENIGGMARGNSKKLENSKRRAAHTIITVSFEIGVTVEEDQLKVAGAGLNIAGLGGAKGKGEKQSKNATVNKLAFSVPIQLPLDPNA